MNIYARAHTIRTIVLALVIIFGSAPITAYAGWVNQSYAWYHNGWYHNNWHHGWYNNNWNTGWHNGWYNHDWNNDWHDNGWNGIYFGTSYAPICQTINICNGYGQCWTQQQCD